MRFLYSCPLDPKKNAALGQHVFGVVRELAKRSHYLSLNHRGKSIPDTEFFQQYILGLKRYRFASTMLCDIQYAYALFKVLKQKNYDCIYYRLGKFSVLPPILFKKPTVLELNADNRSKLLSVNTSVITRKIYPSSEYIRVKLANKVVVVLERIRANLQKFTPLVGKNIVVIENGTDTQTYLKFTFLLTGWIEPGAVAEFLPASEICVAPYSRLASINSLATDSDSKTH